MTRPNLMHADTLCWIAKLGTFSAAAQRLHTTQPAISARMKELESSLGYPLFERRGRRLELTVQARSFVDHVEPLLRSVEDAFNDPEAAANPMGMVRLGVGEISMTWLGRNISTLRKFLPRVTYDITLDLGLKLQEDVQTGTLDAAIVSNSHRSAALTYTPLGSMPMIWVCAARLLSAADGRRRSLEDLLRHETLWSVPKSSDFFAPTCNELRKAGANMANLCMCSKLMGLLQIVTMGGGIALLPKIMVSEGMRAGQLVEVPGHLAPQFLDFAVVVHRNQAQSAVLRLVNALVQLAQRQAIAQ